MTSPSVKRRVVVRPPKPYVLIDGPLAEDNTIWLSDFSGANISISYFGLQHFNNRPALRRTHKISPRERALCRYMHHFLLRVRASGLKATVFVEPQDVPPSFVLRKISRERASELFNGELGIVAQFVAKFNFLHPHLPPVEVRTAEGTQFDQCEKMQAKGFAWDDLVLFIHVREYCWWLTQQEPTDATFREGVNRRLQIASKRLHMTTTFDLDDLIRLHRNRLGEELPATIDDPRASGYLKTGAGLPLSMRRLVKEFVSVRDEGAASSIVDAALSGTVVAVIYGGNHRYALYARVFQNLIQQGNCQVDIAPSSTDHSEPCAVEICRASEASRPNYMYVQQRRPSHSSLPAQVARFQ